MGWLDDRKLAKRVKGMLDVLYPTGGKVKTVFTPEKVLDLYTPFSPVKREDGSYSATLKDGSATCQFGLEGDSQGSIISIYPSEGAPGKLDVMNFALVGTLIERLVTADFHCTLA